MIIYTKQKRLGRFGARWGCFATNLINIVEHELRRRLTNIEVYSVIGFWFIQEHVWLSNYKDHDNLDDERAGWGRADPEWHFYIADMPRALADTKALFHLGDLVCKYEIRELSTPQGSHFVLIIDDSFVINPDPNIEGRVVDRRIIN